MDLTHINQKSYPRVVTASTEGHLRSEYSAQRPAEPQRNTNPPTPAQNRAAHPAEVARQYQEQRADQGAYAGQRSADEARASGYGEQLAAATRQARHTQHSRRRYSPPALVSARGREANRRYLETSMASQPQIIDEVV